MIVFTEKATFGPVLETGLLAGWSGLYVFALVN